MVMESGMGEKGPLPHPTSTPLPHASYSFSLNGNLEKGSSPLRDLMTIEIYPQKNVIFFLFFSSRVEHIIYLNTQRYMQVMAGLIIRKTNTV